MKEMEKLPKLQTSPRACPASVVTGENYRITVLTERMLRLEYSEEQYFEDGATQVVLNRDFAPVNIQYVKTKNCWRLPQSICTWFMTGRNFRRRGLASS